MSVLSSRVILLRECRSDSLSALVLGTLLRPPSSSHVSVVILLPCRPPFPAVLLPGCPPISVSVGIDPTQLLHPRPWITGCRIVCDQRLGSVSLIICAPRLPTQPVPDPLDPRSIIRPSLPGQLIHLPGTEPVPSPLRSPLDSSSSSIVLFTKPWAFFFFFFHRLRQRPPSTSSPLPHPNQCVGLV